jgi:proteasome-associated ATPase
MPELDPREQQERAEKQIHELQTQVRFLEDEIALLRRRLTNAPRQVKILEEKLLESKSDLARALNQNEKLAETLRSEKDRIEGLREEVEKLSQPPASFGVYLASNDDDSVDVFTAGRKMRVNVSPDVDRARLDRGVEVILNEALNVVEVLAPDRAGEVMKVKDRLGEDRVVVVGRGDEELVATIGAGLREEHLRAGDPLLIDPRSNLALEKLPKEEVEELVPRRSPTSRTRTSAGSRARSRPSGTRSSSRSSTRSSFTSTSSTRRRASCSTGRPAAGRRSSRRPWPSPWPTRSASAPAVRTSTRTS